MEFNLRGMEEGIWQVFGDAYRGGVTMRWWLRRGSDMSMDSFPGFLFG